MPLIAMTLEMGSLGNEVAQGIAEALGLKPLHHEIIGDLADKMRVRRVASALLVEPPARLVDVRDAWLKELERR